MIRVGNISLTPKAFKYSTKETFIALFKGKTDVDLNALWAAVCEANKEEEVKPSEAFNSELLEPIDFEKPKKKKKKFKGEE